MTKWSSDTLEVDDFVQETCNAIHENLYEKLMKIVSL